MELARMTMESSLADQMSSGVDLSKGRRNELGKGFRVFGYGK